MTMNDTRMLQEAVEQTKQRSVWLSRTIVIAHRVIKYHPTSIVYFNKRVELSKVFAVRQRLATEVILASRFHCEWVLPTRVTCNGFIRKDHLSILHKLDFTGLMPSHHMQQFTGKKNRSARRWNLLFIFVFFFLLELMWDVILLISGHECRRHRRRPTYLHTDNDE